MNGVSPASKIERVVVLCPMQIEHRAVVRAVRLAGLSTVEVVQTGIGREAVVRAVGRVGSHGSSAAGGQRRPAVVGSPPPGPLPLGGEDSTLVILAGACGALVHVEDVPRIDRVIDEHGNVWQAGAAGDGGEGDAAGVGGVGGVTLIGVDRVVSTPADKRTLAARTGAHVVDMESHAFITECLRLGFSWGVVRGVSDTPDETLPHEILRWITPGGDTRVGAAVMDMVRRPRLVGHVVPVMRRSNRVLPKVGEAVVGMVRGWGREMPG